MIRELIDTEVEQVVGGRHGNRYEFENIHLTNRETVTARAKGDGATAAAQGGDQSNSFSVSF